MKETGFIQPLRMSIGRARTPDFTPLAEISILMVAVIALQLLLAGSKSPYRDHNDLPCGVFAHGGNCHDDIITILTPLIKTSSWRYYGRASP
jgi:hypothetical protein